MDICSPTGLLREYLTISYAVFLEVSFCYYTLALATLKKCIIQSQATEVIRSKFLP